MNLILGSGLTGLLARLILGDDWKFIPFGKSRFFSFHPALDDNFIIRDAKIDDFVEHLGGKPSYMYKTMYSLEGDLHQYSAAICTAWANKMFRGDAPSHVPIYMKSRSAFMVYDLKLNQLYKTLAKRFNTELTEEAKKGDISKIGKNYIMRGGNKIGFDRAVSTIPLSALAKLCGTNTEYNTIPTWYFHIATNFLDFEGANQTLVADPHFDFFKVVNIAPKRYLFYCQNELPQPGKYFLLFMQNFDIIDGTYVTDVIPTGERPKLDWCENLGIQCVGHLAQHDWCMDIGSCIMRLLEIKL